jgi:hypothetical protein
MRACEGAVQHDALRVELHATLRKYYEDIHLKHQEIVNREAAWIEG